jgi:paraquat-inducible protein B
VKVNSTAIGAFVLGAIVLVVVAGMFFSEGRLFSSRDRYVVFFDSSIQGLQLGAPVMLKGVTIGEVVAISAYVDPTRLSIINAAYIDVDARHLVGTDELEVSVEDMVEAGMRAQLRSLSLLTGLLYIEVDFRPDTEIVYRGLDPRYAEIPTIPSTLEALAGSLEDIDLRTIALNIEEIAAALSTVVNNDEFQALSEHLNDAADAIGSLAATVDAAVATLAPEVEATLVEYRQLAGTLNTAVPSTSSDLKQAIGEIQTMVQALDRAVQDISHSLSDDSAITHEVTRAAIEVRRAATAVKVLADTIEQQPESIIRGK